MSAAGEADGRASKHRGLKRLALGVAAMTVAFTAAAGCVVGWTAYRIDPQSLLEPLPQPRVVLLGSDGEAFAARGAYKAAPVDSRTLPPHVVQAVLAIEDRRFFEHHGLDPVALLRAGWANLSARQIVQGGSTISQQLAKTYVGSERTFSRKFREAIVAAALEARLSKDELLSLYLGSIYFGDGVYGLRAAADHYFGKPPEALSLAEAAMLAGLIKAPSRLAPTEHLEAAQARGRLVLAAMADNGSITPAEAASTPAARPVRARGAVPSGGYFADWILPKVRSTLGPAYGEVRIKTTLDPRLQARAERVVADVLRANGSRTGGSQAALVAMRTDGTVVAMVGGRDYRQTQFNRSTQARRQPGSTFKLFVYLAALRAGATPETLVADEPIRIGAWTPKNAGGAYAGPLTFEQAFARSSNVAAVRISEAVGREEVIRAARDLGVAGELEPVPSLALGAFETTLLELTSAYAGVAGGAYPVAPRGLTDQVGVSVSPRRLDWRSEQEPLLRLLRASAQQGTGRQAALPIPVYGKTGTSQDARDAWFVGFAADLVVGVWVGNDDHTPMTRVAGGTLPAQIWRGFMQDALGAEIAAHERFLAEEAEMRRLEEIEREREIDRRPSWTDRIRDFFGLRSARIGI